MIADLVVVGAGPAGLSAAAAAEERGLHAVVLERAGVAGGAWARMPPDMRCLSPRRDDRLPDGSWPPGPGARATAAEVARAWQAFADARSQVRFGVTVTALRHHMDHLRLETDQGPVDARRVVVATGEYGRPHIPPLPGRFDGPIEHSSALDVSAVTPGDRVVVVGAGNSGAEVALRLLRAGARVSVSSAERIRRPPTAPSVLLGRLRFLASGVPVARLPGRGGCRARVAVVEPFLFEAVERGDILALGRVVGLESTGVRLADGIPVAADRVVMATGFRRDTAWLHGTVTLAADGTPRHAVGRSPEIRGLGFVGIPCMRTRRSGFLRGFAADARAVVGALA